MPETAAREKPILFSSPMVQAIVDGRKTQTRRIIKCDCNTDHLGRLLGTWGLSQPPYIWDGIEPLWQVSGQQPKPGDWVEEYQIDVDDHATALVKCPYGSAGDRLWVKEAWRVGAGWDHLPGSKLPQDIEIKYGESKGGRYRHARFMPRWASRITLEITDIRVQRLQEISEEDAKAEGAQPVEWGKWWQGYMRRDNGDLNHCQAHGDEPPEWMIEPRPYSMDSLNETAVDRFRSLWCSINGRDSWEANPWVWAISFRVLPC